MVTASIGYHVRKGTLRSFKSLQDAYKKVQVIAAALIARGIIMDTGTTESCRFLCLAPAGGACGTTPPKERDAERASLWPMAPEA